MNKKWKQEQRKRNRQRFRLFEKIRQHQDYILRLHSRMNGHVYEDRMYRFYHASLKVFWMQDEIAETMKLLKKINPSKTFELDQWFLQIIEDAKKEGEFKIEYNQDFPKHARPIVEAYLHCKYFLDMMVESLKLEENPEVAIRENRFTGLTSGWAAILELYNLRY